MRSKKQCFAFQRFTETPTATPSTLGFGITHQPHEGRDGAKCGAFLVSAPLINEFIPAYFVSGKVRIKESMSAAISAPRSS